MLAKFIYGPPAESTGCIAGKLKSHGPVADTFCMCQLISDVSRPCTPTFSIGMTNHIYNLFVVKSLYLLITRHLIGNNIDILKGCVKHIDGAQFQCHKNDLY